MLLFITLRFFGGLFPGEYCLELSVVVEAAASEAEFIENNNGGANGTRRVSKYRRCI